MIRFSTFISTVITVLSFSAHAEIAVLCGDLEAIESNEKNALVHADFDSESISSIDEVKFLYQYGVKQKVVVAETISDGVISVKTPSSTFLFENMYECENEGSVSVVVNSQQKYPCNCYSD